MAGRTRCRRPSGWVIVPSFSGWPSAGKTTVADGLARRLELQRPAAAVVAWFGYRTLRLARRPVLAITSVEIVGFSVALWVGINEALESAQETVGGV